MPLLLWHQTCTTRALAWTASWSSTRLVMAQFRRTRLRRMIFSVCPIRPQSVNLQFLETQQVDDSWRGLVTSPVNPKWLPLNQRSATRVFPGCPSTHLTHSLCVTTCRRNKSCRNQKHCRLRLDGGLYFTQVNVRIFTENYTVKYTTAEGPTISASIQAQRLAVSAKCKIGGLNGPTGQTAYGHTHTHLETHTHTHTHTHTRTHARTHTHTHTHTHTSKDTNCQSDRNKRIGEDME